MTELPKSPSHDALAATPGDTIVYVENGLIMRAVVDAAGWLPSPKGGRVWSYTLPSGQIIPNTQVTKVEKASYADNTGVYVGDVTTKASWVDRPLFEFHKALEKLEISASLKTSISCLLAGDDESLKVAQFLIGTRIRQLKELKD